MMKFPALLIPFMCLSAVLADESVNDFIRATLLNLKGQMPTGIPELHIPVLDPLGIPTIDEHIKEGAADVKILVDNLKIDGLSKFETRMVETDLQDLRLTLTLSIPRVSGNAVYDLNGKIFNLIPLYGKGGASVQIIDCVCTASAALTMTADGHLQADKFDIDPSFGAIMVNLENILGGGNLGKVVNGLISVIGPTLFNRFKPEIRNELNKIIRGELNKALSQVKLSDIQGGLIPSNYVLSKDAISYEAGNANGFLDQILSNARPTIDKDLDPIDLPRKEISFTKKVMGFPITGTVKVFNGNLKGLRTLYRSGDATMTNTPDGSMAINAHLGLNNLEGYYRMAAKFMNIGPETSLKVIVSSVSVRLSVKQTFEADAHPKLLDFEIVKIDRVDVQFDSGLGPLDFIVNTVVNLVNNVVKGLIIRIVNEPLKKIIAAKLAEITIPMGK